MWLAVRTETDSERDLVSKAESVSEDRGVFGFQGRPMVILHCLTWLGRLAWGVLSERGIPLHLGRRVWPPGVLDKWVLGKYMVLRGIGRFSSWTAECELIYTRWAVKE